MDYKHYLEVQEEIESQIEYYQSKIMDLEDELAELDESAREMLYYRDIAEDTEYRNTKI